MRITVIYLVLFCSFFFWQNCAVYIAFTTLSSNLNYSTFFAGMVD